MRYPIKSSTKTFCDTIATSIARYEKYRCWASKAICDSNRESQITSDLIGFGKRGLLEKGLFRKVHFRESLENLEILEKFLTLGNKGVSDHSLEILENLEILEIPPAKRPLS